MRTSSLIATTVAALSAFSLFAADVEVKANANTSSPKVETDVRRDNDAHQYRQEARVESTVKPINKAHSLIGMEVRNRQDEKLGEIKDFVVDLPTGKISYVALAVGGFLGIGEKLIAVPTSALIPSEKTDKYMILDATRGEIVDAPGFAATNWPDHRNPNFDQTPFWRPKARGSAAVTETGRRDKDVRVETNIDHDNHVHTTMGRIKTVGDDTVIIENAGRTETYSVRNNSIHSSDYKNGDRVTIKYHTENGKMVIDDLARQ